jgi:catechol 2,3-dioxygenase-like lactoylglutathione lyase family enzyme
MASPISNTQVVQIGFVCQDIEKEKRLFAEFLGLPVPQTIDSGDYQITQTRYLGDEAPEASCKMAFFSLPNLQLELIQPNEAASVWHDDLVKNGEGFHHIAFNITGMNEHIQRMKTAGFHLKQQGEYGSGDGRYAYFQGNLLGTTIELLESDPK